MEKIDIAIIGSGIAGLSAGLYGERYNLKTTVFGNEFGGTVAKTHIIENYIGIDKISGIELAKKIQNHYETYGGKIIFEEITKITKQKKSFILNDKIEAKTIIFATGTKHKKLEIDSVKKYENKGVSYCATCDGPLFKENIVAIAGGGDSAVKESLLLAKYAKQVYIIVRKNELGAEKINIENMEKNPKIKVIFNSNIIEASGNEKKLQKIKLDTGKILEVDGLFVEIGRFANSKLASSLGVKINKQKEIIANNLGQTNINRIFAAGDVLQGAFKQAIVSASSGSCAAYSINELLTKEE